VATGDRSPLLAAWRERSATLGRRVRVELGTEDVVGLAVDVNGDGHLVVEPDDGERRTIAVGDVVHLRDG
jgi:BirA family transcriptional regulator, biotin operon repressor / biotin---[acetyl-CoA-carboxylase] ligase